MNKDKFWYEYDSVNDNDLLKWFNEDDYHDVRTTIVNMAIQKMEEFYGD
jgi:hypothetical protein